MSPESDPAPSDASWLATVSAQPWLVALWIVFISCAIVAAITLLPEDWALTRRVLAGLIGGIGCALILSVNRIIGNMPS